MSSRAAALDVGRRVRLVSSRGAAVPSAKSRHVEVIERRLIELYRPARTASKKTAPARAFRFKPMEFTFVQPSDRTPGFCARFGRALVVALATFLVPGVSIQGAQPPAALYRWEPVRLGAGGFVTGFVTHPLDASIRYCRTDVGNAYRWDGHEWRPLLVREENRGMPKALAATPVSCGVDSIAVDPSNKHVVFLTMNAARPEMLKSDRLPSGGNVYKSTDGGITFTPGNLSLSLEPNGPWRTEGERLKVDPNNGQVIFYGSLKEGLWRSQDGGMGWNIVQGHGAPTASDHVLGVHIDARDGTALRDGRKCSRTIFAVMPRKAVLMSRDGGATWTNISAGTKLEGTCLFSTLDSAGVLHVVSAGSRDLWSWRDGNWQQRNVALDWERTPHAVACDARNPDRIFAISDGGGTSRSLDGGKTLDDARPGDGIRQQAGLAASEDRLALQCRHFRSIATACAGLLRAMKACSASSQRTGKTRRIRPAGQSTRWESKSSSRMM